MKWTVVERKKPAPGGNAYVEQVTGEDGKLAAKKTLKESRFDRYDRFRREVRVAGSIQHDNLSPILDSHLPHKPTRGDPPYFVMPWYDGGTLHDRVHRGEYKCSLALAAEVLLPVVRACKHLHDNDVFHRDVKPKNILLTESGVPILVDLGLCYAVDDVSLTATHEMAGSQLYMAPEYLAGKVHETDHSPADVFSLGKTLWAMIAGREPLPGPVLPYAASNLVADCGESARDAQYLCQSLTHLDPAKRPSVAILEESLHAAVSPPTVTAGSSERAAGQAIRLLESAIETDVRYNEQMRAQAEAEERCEKAHGILRAVEEALPGHPEVEHLLNQPNAAYSVRVKRPGVENRMQPGEHAELAAALGFSDIPKSMALTMQLNPAQNLVDRLPMVIAVWSIAVSMDSPNVEVRVYVYSRSNSANLPTEAAEGGFGYSTRIESLRLQNDLIGSVPQQVESFLKHLSHATNKHFKA